MTYFIKYLFTLFKWIIGCTLAFLLTLEMSGPPEGGRRPSDCVPWEGEWRGWDRGTASHGPLIQGYCSHLRGKKCFRSEFIDRSGPSILGWIPIQIWFRKDPVPKPVLSLNLKSRYGAKSIPGTESGIEQPSYIGWRAGTTTLCLLGS